MGEGARGAEERIGDGKLERTKRLRLAHRRFDHSPGFASKLPVSLHLALPAVVRHGSALPKGA